ncbi:hypothetical protein PSTT_09267 [Puccinia striiformis]|uniref:Uncharacterized protein n=1 Tax=Puccinia striiformis TaxID=27350 RepID=A0A2S4V946_9BASI|nr:hypothetical protein PSTT_09267 [Puccinia striiformis]
MHPCSNAVRESKDVELERQEEGQQFNVLKLNGAVVVLLVVVGEGGGGGMRRQ